MHRAQVPSSPLQEKETGEREREGGREERERERTKQEQKQVKPLRLLVKVSLDCIVRTCLNPYFPSHLHQKKENNKVCVCMCEMTRKVCC